jgi:low temperature requirement A protein (LtrA)
MHGGNVWLTNRCRRIGRSAGCCSCSAWRVSRLRLALPQVFDDSGGRLRAWLSPCGCGAFRPLRTGIWKRRSAALRAAQYRVCTTRDECGLPRRARTLRGSIAILIQFVTPSIAARVASRFDIRPRHFVERHGLLLMVVLGESVVAIGIGIGDVSLDLVVLGSAVLRLALAGALWWAYFVGDEDSASRAMASATSDRRFQLAIGAYFYAFIPMLLGIVIIAAGLPRRMRSRSGFSGLCGVSASIESSSSDEATSRTSSTPTSSTSAVIDSTKHSGCSLQLRAVLRRRTMTTQRECSSATSSVD